MPNAQIPSHLLNIYSSALEDETRVPRDHEELFVSRESRNDLLDHSVGKVFLLQIAAHILEWQDGYGGFVRERKRLLSFQWCRRLLSFSMHSVEPYGTIDILERLLA